MATLTLAHVRMDSFGSFSFGWYLLYRMQIRRQGVSHA